MLNDSIATGQRDEGLAIGFAGAGRMATALASALTATPDSGADGSAANPSKKSIDKSPELFEISFFDPAKDAVARFSEHVPEALYCSSLKELCERCRLLVLAVKPQIMPKVFEEIESAVTGEHLVVSVAAGINLAQLESGLGIEKIVRVMPNTPALVGQGMSAIASRNVGEIDLARVRNLLESVGDVVEVDESAMDAVTGLSGSGPAYVFQFIEAMIEGGVKQGLNEKIAERLAIQTVLGAATLAARSDQSAEQLRQQVTSPGGTTQAGLHVLNENGFSEAIREAVAAATARSIELAKPD